MSLLDGPEVPEGELAEEQPRRTGLIVAGGILLLAVAAGAWWMTRPAPEEPAPVAEAAPPPRPRAAAPRRAEPAPEAPREAAPVERAAPRPEPVAPAAEPAAPAAPAGTLTVETDVKAMVFLDRVFLGYSPVTTSEFKPGRHTLNVSAEGYDGMSQSVDLPESGPTTVNFKLAEVRLSEVVEVVHKHRIGSCQGQLIANLSGFTYKPQAGEDGFTIPLNAVETFEINYMDKNLRLKQRGGRTWNFESPTGGADPLFVFHRDVEKARTRLAGQ